MVPPSGAFPMAATPIDPPLDAECWAFHLISASTEPIESLAITHVEYEWGDMGNGVSRNLRLGPVAPGSSLEVWRDDDDAAELRMTISLLVRGGGGERKVMGEFGKPYRRKRLTAIPVLGKEGVLGTTSAGTPHASTSSGIPPSRGIPPGLNGVRGPRGSDPSPSPGEGSRFS
jgi:hypothetical protein